MRSGHSLPLSIYVDDLLSLRRLLHFFSLLLTRFLGLFSPRSWMRLPHLIILRDFVQIILKAKAEQDICIDTERNRRVSRFPLS